MQLRTYAEDAGAFLKRVQPSLEANEAANSLILGITIRISQRPDWLEQPPYLAVIEDPQGSPVLIAIQTPPQQLLLSGVGSVPQQAIDLLIQHLRSTGAQIPGVNAENQLAHQFAESWSRSSGQAYRTQLRERLYALRKVIPPPNPPAGFFRAARMDEVDLLTGWHAAFMQESLHEAPPANGREFIAYIVQAENLYVWDVDGSTVSMAACTRPTPHGVSINNVYTPPELRGHGYASACVAALSQRLLDSGKQFCALFTDLDFPISNAIYQRIGYRPICDCIVYRFE